MARGSILITRYEKEKYGMLIKVAGKEGDAKFPLISGCSSMVGDWIHFTCRISKYERFQSVCDGRWDLDISKHHKNILEFNRK